MGGISRTALALLSVAALSACQRSRAPDTNLLTGRCTNLQRSKGAVPRLPAAPSLRPGFGGVIGTLADSGGALPQYPVRAQMLSTDPNAPHATATPDSLGGFAFDSLPPGRYRLYARAFSHRPDSTDVEVTAGQVATASILLPFFECVR
ncbi:MAG TPA: carboxypeptidase-like regulatory domain-containing protein [Gemmatimonadaceae bacterium]|nr:carboxypeptidase-like regulatory domain-containing protein [Gemmatimonadaceae bacterium]